LRSFFGPDAPSYVRERLAPDAIRASGIFESDAVARLVAKCERSVDTGLGEGEEMGLVGILSTLLLRDAMIVNPVLAPAAIPTREVEGDTVLIPSPGRA